MKTLLGFLLRLVIGLALVVWLADQPGTASIIWRGYRIESSAAFLAVVVLAVGAVFYFLFRLFHFTKNGPASRRLRKRAAHLEQGQELLTQGLVAIAAGQASEAGRLALAARRKLGTTTATLLLQAQAAQLSHDHRAARAIFRAMIEMPESAVLGYRGLIMEARRAGEWDEVERLTAEVARDKPAMPWLDWVRFEIATRRQAWGEAGDALARLAPSRLIETQQLHHHRAALLIAQSQQEAGQLSRDAALQSAEQAVKQTPAWLPALINLAERQAESDYARALGRTIEKAWGVQPHPKLAELLRVTEGDFMAQYKQLTRIARTKPDDPAAVMILAEAAMNADIWGEARRFLTQLISTQQATQNVYRLLAKLERRESGDDKAAMQWLSKAVDAAPDAAWLCSSCGAAHKEWQPTCRACASFATLEWRTPGVGAAQPSSPQPLLSDWS